MSKGFNQQQIVGNLAADAELRHTKDDKPVLNFRVIANTGSGDYQHVEGFNVVLWGALAETLAQFLTKGKQVYVQGETRTRSFEGKDGGKQYRTEVVVTPFFGSIVLLGGGNGAQAGSEANDQPADGEDIPF